MKRIIYIILLALLAGGGLGYAQKKHKEPTAAQLARIAELEKELDQINRDIMDMENKLKQTRRDIVDLEKKFRESYLTKEEEAILQAKYEAEEKSSKSYIHKLDSLLKSEEEAMTKTISDELARRLNQYGGITQIKMEVAEVTSKIQQGLADFSEYDKLFRRQTPDERMFSYKIMQHEIRIRELEGKILKENQRLMISDLKNKIYEKTGYRPSFNGNMLTKLPTDEETYKFIEEIDAKRKKNHGAPLTDKEKNALMDIRDMTSREYVKAEDDKKSKAQTIEMLQKGLEALEKKCPECANQ